MARKCGAVLVVPKRVAGNPDRLAKWLQKRAERFVEDGELTANAGGHNIYQVYGEPIMATPLETVDKIVEFLASLVACPDREATAATI